MTAKRNPNASNNLHAEKTMTNSQTRSDPIAARSDAAVAACVAEFAEKYDPSGLGDEGLGRFVDPASGGLQPLRRDLLERGLDAHPDGPGRGRDLDGNACRCRTVLHQPIARGER